MKIGDLIQVIEAFAAPELQEGYDNAGLITGQAGRECSGVLCCLDATVEVVEEAIQKGCNLVMAHHPIVFSGLKRINGHGYVEKAIITAIKNDIAIYAAHTNLDNVLLGVSGRIAQVLGLRDVEVLEPKRGQLRRMITFAPEKDAARVRDALFAAGAGHIGNYSECSFNSAGTGTFKAGEGADPYVGKKGERHEEPEIKIEIVFPFFMERQVVASLIDAHPYEEVAYDIFAMENKHLGVGAGVIGTLKEPVDALQFLGIVREKFNARGIRHSPVTGKPVQRIAVCGGAGSFLIKKALRAGADLFITSDLKYHEFFDAEGEMVVADIGHYESEQFTVDLMHDLLRQKFPTFAVLKTGINTNPVKYLK